jgi:Protein of unknown function (DUF3429)
MREAGLRALERRPDASWWIAFPHPFRAVQWLVIRLISITVAGAAPGLDESAPDFPFYPPPFRGAGTSRRAKPACALGAPSRQFIAPRRVASSPRVEPLQNDTAPARLGTAAELLGYLAVAPLIVCLACEATLAGYTGRELAQRGAIAWGAVHWGLALAGRVPSTPARMAAAAAPVLVAAAAILLGGQHALALLVVGFGLFWLYEHRCLGGVLPPAYLGLRRNLSLATCTLLALTMIASDAAGLL